MVEKPDERLLPTNKVIKDKFHIPSLHYVLYYCLHSILSPGTNDNEKLWRSKCKYQGLFITLLDHYIYYIFIKTHFLFSSGIFIKGVSFGCYKGSSK